MATYLKGGVDYFPQETLFTPDYNLIQQTLQYKQGQYDRGFAQLSKTARSIIDSDVTSAYSKDKRKQILANAEQALKNLPNIDLSLPQNLNTAYSIFQPFYEDDALLTDIMKTKSLKSEIQRGMSLRDSDKEEERNRYWNIGVQDLYDNLEDLSKATDPQQITGLRTRRFVGKPQVSEKILKMFNDGKLKVSYDYLSGQYKYTDENGKALKDPITNMYLSMAENDPEAMEGYNTIGRVKRRKYIDERAKVLGSPEAAAKEHDDALLADYYNTQNKIYNSTTDAMQKLNVKLEAWKSKAESGQLVEGSQDEQEAINDQRAYDALKVRADNIKSDIFSIDGKPAPYISRIGNNPTSYLGLIELNKSAIDLATSLSQFGSRKVDVNPIYEKFVYPFQKAEFDNQKAKELSQFNTNENLREEEGKIQLKLKYGIPLYNAKDGDGSGGDGSGGTGKPGSPGALNIPVVEDTQSGSGVSSKDEKGQPDVFGEMEKKTNELVGDVLTDKLRFIETVLDPSEITTTDGKFISSDERSKLHLKASSASINVPSGPITEEEEKISMQTGENPLVRRKRLAQANTLLATDIGRTPVSDGKTELDRLYENAVKKYSAYKETGVLKPEWQRLHTQVQVKENAWTSSIQFKKEKFTELIGNMAASDPKEGFVYNSLFDGVGLVDNEEEFLTNIQKNPGFVSELKKETDKAIASLDKTSRSFGFNPISDPNRAATVQRVASQTATALLEKYRKNFNKYLTDIKTTWNKSGNEWNYYSTNQQKGSGIYGKSVTFTGSSKVAGEIADVYTNDLLTMLSKYQTRDGFDEGIVKVDFGMGNVKGEGDNPKDSDIPNDSNAVSLFNKLKPILRNTIKPGGTASEIEVYNIKRNPVAGNNTNWSSYTFTLQPKLITELTSTSATEKLLTDGEAKKLQNGITIFVKKDNDQTMFSRATQTGEVQLLLNANKGLLNTEIAPGYSIQISKNATGTYKITSNYVDIANVNNVATEIPRTISQEVNMDADLTTMYYDIMNGLQNQIYKNEDAKKRLTSSNTPPQSNKVNWNSIQQKARQ